LLAAIVTHPSLASAQSSTAVGVGDRGRRRRSARAVVGGVIGGVLGIQWGSIIIIPVPIDITVPVIIVGT
jgi:hypothetical protein